MSSMLKSCMSMRFMAVLKLWPARLCKCKVREGFSAWERRKIAFIDDIRIEINPYSLLNVFELICSIWAWACFPITDWLKSSII